LTLLLICYTPQKPTRGRRIECCGPQLTIMALKGRAIINLCSLKSLTCSLRKVFRRLRPCSAWLSLHGQQLWVELSQLIILEGGGFTLVNWCCLCKNNEEIVNLYLIHSEYTSDLWYLVFNLFRFSWAMMSNILELLHCWKNQGWGHPKEAI
jgi:hypothetical protein